MNATATAAVSHPAQNQCALVKGAMSPHATVSVTENGIATVIGNATGTASATGTETGTGTGTRASGARRSQPSRRWRIVVADRDNPRDKGKGKTAMPTAKGAAR